MPYYAVARGFKVGIFNTLPECDSHVKGFEGALFKKFGNIKDAKAFIELFRERENVSSSFSVPLPDSNDITTLAAPISYYAVARGHTDANAFIEANREQTFVPISSPEVLTKSVVSVAIPNLKRTYESTVEICGGNSPVCLNDALDNNGRPSKQFAAVPGINIKSQGPIVYTDGACSSNGRHNAKTGYGVFWGDGHKNNVGAPLKGPATNNRAEYTAVIVALEQAIADGCSHITIRTDSNLLIMSMTQWLRWWKKNKYKKLDGTPVLNVDLIKELDNLMQNIFVKFEHVKAHVGIYGNEMADKLARQGAKKYIRG